MRRSPGWNRRGAVEKKKSLDWRSIGSFKARQSVAPILKAAR
jgi:hypothetical protein